MVKRIIIVSVLYLLVSLSFVSSGFAFQFEDFKWGSTRAAIVLKLRTKEKDLMFTTNKRIIKYSDTILNDDCSISLEFTPQTNVLASIKIMWRDKSIGEDVKQLLTKKYGKLFHPNVFVEEYHWIGATPYERIVLNFDYAATTLTYFGGDFQEKYEEEFEELLEKEKTRF
ncbi:hypothetical protein ACFL38_03680 [Candidatus Omnitrophota bacterium]